MITWLQKRWKTLVILFSIFLIWFINCLPTPLFDTPLAKVLTDEENNLLGAQIATDGQWRFPLIDSIPSKFEHAIITFEDKRFYKHPGIDFRSMGRALTQNIRSGQIISGGSTISMQVIRLARKNPKRNIWNKILETIQAVRLEWSYSKKEILQLYATYAPFGGNVVGVETASWRYYSKPPSFLSWGEAATLAVLPNAPALIHPARNRDLLLSKRNKLLRKLKKEGLINELELELALEEPLPEAPKAMPRMAPHLLDRLAMTANQQADNRFHSNLNYHLQQQVNQILSRYQQVYRQNGIHNIAALVIEVETAEVKAYVGNVLGAGADHGEQVDVITAPRSTGSILKPFLYGLAVDDGLILPYSLIQDIPTIINGYRPENFYQDYDGLLPANQALSRSLNIPFVLLLQEYGLEKFHFQLKKMGLKTLTKPADHYGLTLILGGAEGTLEQISKMYTGMARTMLHYQESDGEYLIKDFGQLSYLRKEESKKATPDWRFEPPYLSAASIWHTFEAMKQVERPDSEGQWQQFRSSQEIAWKTGTSFGFRDAWAVGVSPTHVVGVWVGNADGEGRPGLVGVRSAAPILFDIFDRLPSQKWWLSPLDEMRMIRVCKHSGYPGSPICPSDSMMLAQTGEQVKSCPYHELIQLDSSKEFRVNSSCYLPQEMKSVPWFVVPPIEASYFQLRQAEYKSLPPWMPNCELPQDEKKQIQLIYPKRNARLYIPLTLKGGLSKVIFKAAHVNPTSTIYWHIDRQYVASTQYFHTIELAPLSGEHTLTLVDENGNVLESQFEVIAEENNAN